MDARRQVIIGNSAAALSAIQAMREVDTSCPITLISAESCNAYSPVLLTYYLRGKINRNGLFIVDGDFYRSMKVNTVLGNLVVEIDSQKQILRLADGATVGYDNLLIAAGATPASLSGSENLTSVFSIRTLEDAERILAQARVARKVIVIGAGLIGLQASDALSANGVDLTVMEGASQVLPESIDAESGLVVKDKIESRGISVLLGQKIKGLEKNGESAVVVSDSGEKRTADMVIVGIGLRPNTGFTRGSGIEVNRGIVVDRHLRTSIGNIFAAGDITEGENLVSGKKEVIPTWTNACRQGRVAGLNMAGAAQTYEGGIREMVTSVFGLTIAALGMSRASSNDSVEELRFADPRSGIYRKILLRGDRIVGAVLLGRIGDVGILGNLIRSGKDVSLQKRQIVRNRADLKMLLPAGLERV